MIYDVLLWVKLKYQGKRYKPGDIVTVKKEDIGEFAGLGEIVLETFEDSVIIEESNKKEALRMRQPYNLTGPMSDDKLALDITGWILSNFDSIKEQVEDMTEQNDTFYSVKMGYPVRFNYNYAISGVETYILSRTDYQNIIEIIQDVIYAFDSDMFDIMVRYFWDQKTCETISEEIKDSNGFPCPRTVKRRSEKIKQDILEALDDKEISFNNLFWFGSKFGYRENHKKVC
jgi:hypothetical protein